MREVGSAGAASVLFCGAGSARWSPSAIERDIVGGGGDLVMMRCW